MNRGVLFFFSIIILAAGIIAFYQAQRRTVISSPEPEDAARQLYQKNCARCHGSNGEGFAMNPPLKNTGLSLEEITTIMINGSGEMPSFKKLTEQELRLLANFVLKM